MNSMFKNWSAARIIRLVVGLGLVVFSFIQHEYLFLIVAAMLLLQAVLNVSCCGVNGCSSVENPSKTSVYKDEIKPYKDK